MPYLAMASDHDVGEAPKDLITIREMAELLGRDRSSTHKAIKKRGVRTFEVRSADTGGQLAKAVERSVFEELKDEMGVDKRPVEESTGPGYFYAITIAPDLAGHRLKFGFARDVDRRLQEHRCAAPTAEVLRTWPCRKTWECAALDVVSAVSTCVTNSPEVFDVYDIAGVFERLDQFFGLLPNDCQ